jgi:hypothetical protein
MAFFVQLAGKVGASAASCTGNGYLNAFLPGYRAASNPAPRFDPWIGTPVLHLPQFLPSRE